MNCEVVVGSAAEAGEHLSSLCVILEAALQRMTRRDLTAMKWVCARGRSSIDSAPQWQRAAKHKQAHQQKGQI